ncbi:hypothetical protein GQ600_14545 [Phytophthora cactorum]|nr:hypothetical protein GQ600_14545 [Phytophthora cactorum]
MKRLIVTDSFYATVSLSLKLLDIGLLPCWNYTNGWCPTQFTMQKTSEENSERHLPHCSGAWPSTASCVELARFKACKHARSGLQTKVTSVLRTEKDGSRNASERRKLVTVRYRPRAPAVNTDSFYTTSKQHKRRQHLCKVCSAFSDLKTSLLKPALLPQCSDAFGGRLPLCCQRDAWRVATRRHAQRSGRDVGRRQNIPAG